MKEEDKKGLSTVVITLIIILVSLVAIAIIWVAVKNLINKGSEGITMGQFTMEASVEVIGINETRNNVSLIITRNPGQGDFTGIAFVFENITGKEKVEKHFILYELESKGFELHLEQLNVSNLTILSIYPLFKTSSSDFTLGAKTDEYIFTGIEKFLFRPGGGGICGNNILEQQVGEACDGTPPVGDWGGVIDCTSLGLGYISGAVTCEPPGDMRECRFDTSLCVSPTPQCSDTIDNDANGCSDYPADPGCSSAADTTESGGTCSQPQCSDGTDNDANGCADFSGGDTGCSSASDNSESGGTCPQTQCSDGTDNDANGCSDYPTDTGCSNAADNSESGGSCPAGNIYWISSTGTATWANCKSATPLSGTAACPLNRANNNAVAGDLIYLRAGTYTQYINPVNSGTSAQRITYQNYGSEVVTIQDAVYGIFLNGDDYITVQGINFYNLDRFMYLESSANYNTVAYCNFDQMRNDADWAGSRIWEGSSYNWIHDCRFSNYGGCISSDDIGSVLEIGWDDGDASYCGNYNLIENNVMFNGGHHVLGVQGTRNVIRNNYLYNYAWTAGKGNRDLYLNGYASSSNRNLIEGNRIGYSDVPCDSWGAPGSQISTEYNIFRKNYFFFNNLAGLQFSTTDSYYAGPNYNKIYSNTFYDNGWQLDPDGLDDPQRGQITFNDWSSSYTIKYNQIKNNLFYNAPRVFGYDSAVPGDQTFSNNYNGDTQGDPKFVNAGIFGVPSDIYYPNLSLQPTSPCIDTGGALTTITSASGSGTTFRVSDAGFFMDGWGVPGVVGDEIRIIGTSQIARIVSVNYATNDITVNQSVTWTQNQGISLGYEGSAPDIGAYESTGTPQPQCSDGVDNDGNGCSDYPADPGCSSAADTTESGGTCSDTTPPVRSNGLPTGTLPAGTTQTNMSLTTNEAATCRYSATAGVAYSSMTNTFTGTALSHSRIITGLTNGTAYTYYVRCSDTAGNANTNDYPISFSVASPPSGGTVYALSCSYADVSSAISSANRGDTVQVPVGTCSWSSTLTITKGINLIGAGIGNTVITRSGQTIVYNPDATSISNDIPFKVSGFTFDGGGANIDGQIELNNLDTSRKITRINIGNNKLQKNSGTGITIYGQLRGVIYNNEFDKVGVIIEPMGLDTREEWETFGLSLSYGTNDNLYFEDNTIHYSSSFSGSDPGWMESGQCGRIVVRYNTWDMTNSGDDSEYWDIHGSQYFPGGQHSTMIVEYYGNIISHTISPYRWAYHRGSWGLFFNNAASGSGSMSNEVAAYTGGCDENVPGTFSTEVNNTYFWNDNFNGIREDATESEDFCGISENSNWWNYNPSCTAASCSAGIGCGSTAPTGTCTTGVGYWVTSYSPCSSVPTTMAELKTYTQAGRFYKCTSTNTWSLYYQPYTYPNPLRST